MDAYVSVKGQIVIPAKMRRKHGIKAGTKVVVTEDETRIILQPITREFMRNLRGKYKGKGLLKALMAERKWEREREKERGR